MRALKTAEYFGADAVYASGKSYGLRASAENFTAAEIKEAARCLHARGKKLYIAVNAFFRDEDFKDLNGYLKQLREARVDALIISDPGVLSAAMEIVPEIPVHLSTQANTMNSKSALFWHKHGVKRIVMSREISLAEISEIRNNTPDTLEIEAFVHGAMCISYSGRCLLSSFLKGRSANRGQCAQPCRWEFGLNEKGFAGEYFPVSEDGRGTYILNSKDLCMIEHLKEIAESGITSVKIEGRMKSEYYVGCVTKAYRRAIDDLMRGEEAGGSLLAEVNKAGSRAFTTGFYFGDPMEEGEDTNQSGPFKEYDFVAAVTEQKNKDGLVRIEQRGKFSKGDTLEVLSPVTEGAFTVTDIFTIEGVKRTSAPHPQETLLIACPYDLNALDMLRKKRVI